MNLVNAQNSPIFSTIYGSYPANIYLHYSKIYNSNAVSVNFSNDNLYLSRNFNTNNVILGEPVIYTGSQDSYDNFLLDRLSSTINGSTRFFIGPSKQLISYSNISNYFSSNLCYNELLKFNLTFELTSWQGDGNFLIGVAANSSDPFGYGVNNTFYGLGGISYNNKTGIVQIGLNYINSTQWQQETPACIPVGKIDSAINIQMYLGKSGINYYFFWDVLNKWYISPPFKDGNSLKYVTFHNYLNNNNDFNYSLITSEVVLNENINIIPIFSDSFFGNYTNFINAIKNTDYILNCCLNPTQLNLVESALVWNSSSQVLEPSAYAIDDPNEGWFQVFNNQAPQGTYYGEGINPELLPIQSGYGDYRGYAETIIQNSSINIPFENNQAGILSINLLYSPIGSILDIIVGNHIFKVNTYSTTVGYRWIRFNITNPEKSIRLVNENGIQSINLIDFTNNTLFSNVCNEIKGLLLGKHINEIPTKGYYSVANNSSKFYPYLNTNYISISSNDSNALIMILPENVNFNLEAKASNQFAQAQIVPAWGNYLGILVDHALSKNLKVEITSPKSNLLLPLSFYSMPILAIIIIYFQRRRMGEKKYSNQLKRSTHYSC